MNIRNIFLKSQKRFYLLGIVFFLISSFFICHTAFGKTTPLVEYNLTQHDRSLNNNSHYSFDFCHLKKKGLANKDDLSILINNNQPSYQNQQKSTSNSSFGILQSSFDLTKQREEFFISSENFLYLQTSQLLTIVLLE